MLRSRPRYYWKLADTYYLLFVMAYRPILNCFTVDYLYFFLNDWACGRKVVSDFKVVNRFSLLINIQELSYDFQTSVQCFPFEASDRSLSLVARLAMAWWSDKLLA
jgi:hypothetical protein